MFPSPGKSEFSLEPNPPKSKGKSGDPATSGEDPKPEKPAPEKPAEPIKPEAKPDDAPATKEGDAKPDKKPATEQNPEPKPAKESDKKE